MRSITRSSIPACASTMRGSGAAPGLGENAPEAGRRAGDACDGGPEGARERGLEELFLA
ncbi:hypothetical protein GCM10022205_51080 [Spinactinospora alkalitolerans]